ncbi:lysozyme inhibitor LprI family protein [Pectobacterium versatile]|uniref:lysozyme inhibitor LprI family protein n=1 Tax=Pectobacterium versatile TaxID=2488639 RepID=UPI001F2B813B|nr:lysozyme inhibitor LprI family protein [Pectobacterium versatile]
MKNVYLCMLILFAVNGISPAFGEIYWSKLDSMEKILCKDIMKGKSYHEVDICIERMLADSTEKLEQKNKEVISFLSTLITMEDEEDAVKLFKKDQAAWVNYVTHRCAYKGFDYEKDSPIYFAGKSLCEAVENYRRIESLDGELNIP